MKTEPFKHFNQKLIDNIIKNSDVISLPRGAILYDANQNLHFLYIIIIGEIKLMFRY